jgi:4-amino-4-deoxy-L-arabinose transferase-like glycosyltransferase
MLRSPISNPPFPRPRRDAPARHVPWEALAMVMVAFALRALYLWGTQGRHATPGPHEADIDAIAWNLARSLGFRLGDGAALHPTALYPPVVPFITGLLYRVTGQDYFAALLLQCAAGALLPVALAGFARATWGSGVGRVAGWLAAVHPLLVVACGSLLPESLFALALLLALAASAEWVKTPRPARALGTGLLWGLAILTSPGAIGMPLLVAAWSWFPLGLTLAGRDRLRQVALLLLGVALAVGPWALRNARELHAFVPVTTGVGRALLDANNPLAWNDPGRRGEAMSIAAIEPWASPFRGLSEPSADSLSGAMAREFLKSHRGEWPEVAAARLARFWGPGSDGGLRAGPRSRTGLPLALLLAWSVVVLPLALFGAYTLLASPKRLFLALPLVTITAFTASAVVYSGEPWLRVPIESLVALHAAVGADALWNRWRWRHRKLKLVPARD